MNNWYLHPLPKKTPMAPSKDGWDVTSAYTIMT